MKKTILAILISVGFVNVANAYCEISPSHKIQFCAEKYKLEPGQTAVVEMAGVPASDFTVKPVLGYLKIQYLGKITEPKKGKVLVLDSNKKVVHTIDFGIITTDYTAGYTKVIEGTKTLLNELK